MFIDRRYQISKEISRKYVTPMTDLKACEVVFDQFLSEFVTALTTNSSVSDKQ
jgi:hypothetical protein